MKRSLSCGRGTGLVGSGPAHGDGARASALDGAGGRAVQGSRARRAVAVVLSVVCLLALVGRGAEARSGPIAEPSRDGLLRVLFAGDTYFGESYVDALMVDPGVTAGEYSRGFAGLQPLLEDVDFTILNAEMVLTERRGSCFGDDKDYLHRADPVKTIHGLRALRVAAVSLANNHVFDYGEGGLADCLRILGQAGIASFGAGDDEVSAALPWCRRGSVEGLPLRLVVVAGYVYRERYDRVYDAYAEGRDEGVNLWTPTGAVEQVRRLRVAMPDALLVAFPHWGRNYEWEDAEQERLADAMIGAGADVVLGHGSHTLQGIECRQGKWVLYSIGNGVFNSPGQYDERDAWPFSMLPTLIARRQGNDLVFSLRAYPILSDNRLTRFRPRLSTQREAAYVGAVIAARCDADVHPRTWVPRLDEGGWHFELPIARREGPAPTPGNGGRRRAM
ncbi:MAG: CapA family protein [Lentisphaeria bacterium]|nr:CapA family protein [Lentisphaeria bacterium]